MDFSRRSLESELMDTEPVTEADFARCLADLAVVNRITLAHRPTLAWLETQLAEIPRGSEVSLLDVGFGEGDMLRAVRRLCERNGVAARLSGVDLNPLSTAAARAATPPAMQIAYETGDVFALAPERKFDFIICSLFTHHLTHAQIVAYLRWLEQHAARGWFINDLHRHKLSYHGFRVIAAAGRFHRFVRHDGPVSIARSFRREDWEGLLAEAGVPAEIRWHLPFRYCVASRRSTVRRSLAA